MTGGRCRRVLAASCIFGLIGVWAPDIVDAHAEFEDAPASVTPDSDIPLTLRVEHERGDGNYNVGVAVRLPAGWTAISCETKPTWTCGIATESQHVVVRFDKDEGAAPAEDETFDMVLHSSTTPGTASFPVLQTYSTGEEVGWIGDPGSEEPAPVLEVADISTTTQAPLPTTALSPDTITAEPASTIGTGSTGSSPALEPTSTEASDSGSDDGSTGVILAIALVLAAAAAGTVVYLRRQKDTPPTNSGG